MPNPRRANGTRRDKLRARVLREESSCHLCEQPVNVCLPHGLPGSPEVDELSPVSHGGDPLSRANTRLAHRWCNRRRSAMPVEMAKALILANPPRFGVDGEMLVRSLAAVSSRRWL